MEIYLMGIDLGTQGVKCAVYTPDGKLVRMEGELYRTRYPEPGLAEQNPWDWWFSIRDACKRLFEVIPSEAVQGIVVCATSSTVLLVDKNGIPKSPAILWMDTRASAEAMEISEAGHEILEFCGGSVSPEWMTAKSLWFVRNYHISTGDKLVEALDWINFKLTGRWVASQCNATCKWNYVAPRGGFQEEFFAKIGFPEYKTVWPTTVLPVGTCIGNVSYVASAELGLPQTTRVFQGGIDAHVAMIGSGAVQSGQMSLVMGTSFVHLVHDRKPCKGSGLWGPYPDALVKGMWLHEGGQLSAGILVNWFMEQFYHDVPDEKRECVLQHVIEKAKEIPPGSAGLVALDFWQGNRTPYKDPTLRGALWGFTLSHSRYHVFRALLESVSFGTRLIIEQFKGQGLQIESLHGCGGVVKNSFWMQMIADAINIPIKVPEYTESGTLGCAIIAARGLGLYETLEEAVRSMVRIRECYEPDPGVHRMYSAVYETYRKTIAALAPIMREVFINKKNSEGGIDGHTS